MLEDKHGISVGEFDSAHIIHVFIMISLAFNHLIVLKLRRFCLNCNFVLLNEVVLKRMIFGESFTLQELLVLTLGLRLRSRGLRHGKHDF
jgi:hypothetical protein